MTSRTVVLAPNSDSIGACGVSSPDDCAFMSQIFRLFPLLIGERERGGFNNQKRVSRPMVVRTVVHFEIPAADTERLSRFYSECFGWKFEKVPIPDMEYWLITTGPRGKSVGGGMYKKMSESDRPRNFIAVDKIDEAIRKFKAAGGSEIVGKQEVPGQGWSFIGADPEGNVLALWEQRAQPRPSKRGPAKESKKARRGRR
jgi:predicted enzyme related to lactoylglutathione lyase